MKPYYGKELILDIHDCDTKTFNRKHIMEESYQMKPTIGRSKDPTEEKDGGGTIGNDGRVKGKGGSDNKGSSI